MKAREGMAGERGRVWQESGVYGRKARERDGAAGH